jgi:hypothetical protein
MRKRVSCLASLLLLLAFATGTAVAGGPRYIAGTSYFNNGTVGTPLTWANGTISYYTDQGDLSQILPGSSADAFVANAFSQWTSVSTAAISATRAGQLAEDVNGSNVYRNSDGTITMPADILPSAVETPVGVVYDEDGSVLDALLGQGAGDPSQCFDNAVIGSDDNFGPSANFLHALVILNGNCAQNSSQLTDVEYRLVRVLGRVLGLDWSQANLNVITGKPHPTQDDYAGFPLMHAVDPMNCIPITLCYPNPYTPKVDDQAALSRLYPVTSQNQQNFQGKRLFSANTARIHGSVYFTNSGGQAAQAMQGVNVVARWIDPTSGLPSGKYVVSSVSGFLFSGNAGNIVTGFSDDTGQPFSQYGSDDPTVEGFFDLAGLQIPNGNSSAQFQVTVEALDPLWSVPIGPYGPWQVQPSGSFSTAVVNVSLGTDTEQDVLMQGSGIQTADWFGPTTYQSPAGLPVTGDWTGSLSGYGDLDYFWFSGQANRTLSILVSALDEHGNITESKSQPVIGIWQLSDPGTSPAPANTPSAFNSLMFGTTQLNAQLAQTTGFRIGISDIRGDGRPDYRYHARVLYGDHINPTRASVAGGTTVAIAGIGFQPQMEAQVGSVQTPPLSVSAGQILINAPAGTDGVSNVSVTDAGSHSSSTLSEVLTYGAGPTDTLKLVAGANPGTPVGGQAPNAIQVQVVAADGKTPVAGASVFWTASPAVSFSACGGATSCTVMSDETGQASTLATVLTASTMTITAQLAPATYQNPQQVQTTLLGTESPLDLSLLSPYGWIAQGASVNVPLTVRVLSNGSPVNGRTVNYYLTKGSGSVSPGSENTNSQGYATSTLQVSSMNGDEQVVACVEPGDAPCKSYYGTSVPSSSQSLVPVSGDLQVVNLGQNFQPVTVRVTDSSPTQHPVQGASVTFQTTIGRAAQNELIVSGGDTNIGNYPMPIVLGTAEVPVVTDASGAASMLPSGEGFPGPLLILGTASTGGSSLNVAFQSLWPVE